jgi:hypothetical protein
LSQIFADWLGVDKSSRLLISRILRTRRAESNFHKHRGHQQRWRPKTLIATASPTSSEVSERLSAVHRYTVRSTAVLHSNSERRYCAVPLLGLVQCPGTSQSMCGPCVLECHRPAPLVGSTSPHLAARRYQRTALVPELSWGPQSPETVDCPVWPAGATAHPLLQALCCTARQSPATSPRLSRQLRFRNRRGSLRIVFHDSFSAGLLCCCSSAVHVGWQRPRQHTAPPFQPYQLIPAARLCAYARRVH